MIGNVIRALVRGPKGRWQGARPAAGRPAPSHVHWDRARRRWVEHGEAVTPARQAA